MKDCKDCPSFLTDPDEIRKRFKRNPGGPVCGRYGHILSRPSGSASMNEAVRQSFASDCSAHGEPLPATPVSVAFRVAEPDPDVLRGGRTEEDPDIGNTCRNCVNYIGADFVAEAFGWGAPLCAATGKLIANDRVAWKTCGYAKLALAESERWTSRHSMTDITLQDQYKISFRLDAAVVTESMTAHIDLKTPPGEYKSDLPVAEEDKAKGIRAWRAIKDPNGTNVASLPIFDPNFFSEEERAKIPQHGSDEHPELYLDYNGLFYTFAIEARVLEETPVLQANPGVGKTEFARSLAFAMGLPFERIVFRQRMDADALLGSSQYHPDEGTYFQPGRLPLSWEKPNVLLLDEPNLVEDDDVLHALRPLTDNSKELVIEGVSGGGTRGSWRFQRNEHCYLLLAQNPSWDPRNIGTRELASADANRLSVLSLEDPPEAIVRQIVQARCALDGYDIPASILDAIINIAKDIHALEADGAFPDHWGTRQQIKVARKTRWYGVVQAYKIAALDLYAPEVAALVMQSVASHVGTAADAKAAREMDS
jgi:hypothetical protein